MKKQNSIASVNSENKNNRRRNKDGGKGAQNDQKNNQGKQQQEVRAEPIQLTEDELKTKMQVLFTKYVRDNTSREEEKKEEFNVQLMKDLIQNG